MKNFRRALSLILVFALVVSPLLNVVDITVYADGGFIYADDAQTIITGYDGPGGDIIIPAGVIRIENNAFKNNASISGVQFQDGIQEIGNSAFQGCAGLRGGLVIPNSVTSLGINAFNGCSGFNAELVLSSQLTRLNEGVFANCSGFNNDLTDGSFIPESVTSIGDRAFHNCTGLSGKLTIPDNITLIGSEAFMGCTGLSGEIDFSENLLTIGGNAFANCTGLTGTLTIPDSVTSITGHTFRNANGIEHIVVGSSVTHVYENYPPFENCNSVKTVTINNPTVINHVNNLIYGMWALETVYVPLESYGDYQNALNLPAGVSLRAIGVDTDFIIDENNVLIGYQGAGGAVTIPDEVVEIGYRAFKDKTAVTSVTFNEGLQKIGAEAFMGSGLSGALNFPSTLNTIENKAFYLLSTLTGGLTIPDSVTSIGDEAFRQCTHLDGALDLGDGLESLGTAAFYGCTNLSGHLTLPASLSNLGNYAFLSCSGFNGLTLEAASGNGGLKIIPDYAFRSCSGFSGALTIPDNITDIGREAFMGCAGLSGEIDFSENLLTIGGNAFANCTGLTGTLTIPDSVTSITGHTFRNAYNIEHIVVGSCVTHVYENYPPFENCNSVKTVTIKNPIVINYVNNLIHGMSSLETVYVPPTSYGYYENAFNLPAGVSLRAIGVDTDLIIDDNNVLIGYQGSGGAVTIPDEVVEIGYRAFRNKTAVTSVTLNEGLQKIGAEAFMGSGICGALNLPSTLTTIENRAFYQLGVLTGGLTIPNSVTTIGDEAFKECTGFNGALDLGDGLEHLGTAAFCGCTNLSGHLTLPASLKSLGTQAFDSCSSFSGLTLEAASGGGSLTTIDNYTFRNCIGLNGTLTIPDNITEIGKEAFFNCRGLSGEIDFSDNLLSIGENAFTNCNGLTGTLTIPDSVTSISSHAFRNANNIEHIVVGSGVMYLYKYYTPFYNCSNVKTVTLTNPTVINHVNNLIHDMSALETVYVPSESFSAYQDALNLPSGVTLEIDTRLDVPTVTLSKSGSAIKVSWQPVSGATGYQVYRADKASGPFTKFKTTSLTSYTNSGNLVPGMPYYYKVRAYRNDGGNYSFGDFSDVKGYYAPGALAAPAKPSLTLDKNGNGIRLNWNAQKRITGYQVFRSLSPDKPFSYLKTASGSATKYTNLAGLVQGRPYYYKIRAYRMAKGVRKYSAYSTIKGMFAGTNEHALAAVSFSLEDNPSVSAPNVRVRWTGVSGADGYCVYRWNSAAQNWTGLKKTGPNARVYTNINGVANHKTNFYGMRPYHISGGTTYYGNIGQSKGYRVDK